MHNYSATIADRRHYDSSVSLRFRKCCLECAVLAVVFLSTCSMLYGQQGTWFTLPLSGTVDVFQNGALSLQFNTQYSPESGVYVDDTVGVIRTAGPLRHFQDKGAEYTLTGSFTGVTTTNTSRDVGGAVWDAAYDGNQYVYAVLMANNQRAFVHRCDKNYQNWSGRLFGIGNTILPVSDRPIIFGITYDRAKNTLWTGDWNGSKVRQWTLNGTLVSSFDVPGGGARQIGALAYDPTDETLWLVNNAAQVHQQYDRVGNLLSSYAKITTNQIRGGEIGAGPDNTAPTVSCPAPVTSECNAPSTRDVTMTVDLADDDGDALDVAWFVNGSTNPERAVTTTNTTDSFTHTFGLGASEVTVVVFDGTAEPVSCSTVVTIVDTEDPVAMCGPDVVVDTDPGACNAADVVLPEPVISDNCGPVTVSNNAPEAGTFPLGTTTVVWTFMDAGNNSVTCEQSVTVEDNEPPVISTPADITVLHDSGTCDAVVYFGNATASDNCGIASVTNNASGNNIFPVGTTEIVWTVTDDSGNQAVSTQFVNVTNTDPVADAGNDEIIECTSPTGTSVSLDGSASSDPDTGDILSYQWSAVGITFDDPASATPTAAFPLGSTTVTLVVSDQCDAKNAIDVIIVVEDTTAPQIQAAVVDKQALWPPNHDMIPVLVDLLVRDTCENPQDLVLTCDVSSDEPDDAQGDGAFTGDVDGLDGYLIPVPVSMTYNSTSGRWEGGLLLRAERDGGSDGRKYSIVCHAIDASGNLTTATVCVTVPHSKGKGNK